VLDVSLAQEKEFMPHGSIFRQKMAWKIPTRSVAAAEKAIAEMRINYKKMNPDEKKLFKDLLFEAVRTLIHMTKNKRRFTREEQEMFFRIALMYNHFKSELGR